MATIGRDTRDAPAGDVAARLREAGLVRLVSAADGDGLAATGTLARALSATGTPFQASVAAPFADVDRRTDADLTVAVGSDVATADLTLGNGRSASVAAFAVAGELGASPDPVLALAGTIAAGDRDETVADAAERAGCDRRVGVATPTDDLADGLAHSTLVSASFSGDGDAARERLAELGIEADATRSNLSDDDRRRVASLVALDATDDDATVRATAAIERFLRPYEGGPFETVGGFADVLDATARAGTGVALELVLGDADDAARDRALDAWRAHGTQAHEGVRACDTTRYDGLVVARGPSMPVATVAGLLADFRSPEPVVLAVDNGEAAAHAVDGTDVASALVAAAEDTDGDAIGAGPRARARFDGDADDFIAAFREIL